MNGYADEFKYKEQTMRNTIRQIDRDIPKVLFSDVIPGEMFRYPKSSRDDNIYMRTDSTNSCVLLASGAHYVNTDATREVDRVSAIQISR